jgi:hypothetical protein
MFKLLVISYDEMNANQAASYFPPSFFKVKKIYPSCRSFPRTFDGIVVFYGFNEETGDEGVKDILDNKLANILKRYKRSSPTVLLG